MNIQLDDWQQEVLDYEGDLLLCTGRRVGKTYVMARKAVERCLKSKTQIIVVSLTEDQAKLIIMMAQLHADQHHPRTLVIKGLKKSTSKSLLFKNGSTIIARPVGATGNAVRGFEGGILIVDEASRMPKSLWHSAKPVLLTTGGHIWMASTPHGKRGYFYEQYAKAFEKKDPNARFKVWHLSSEQVVYDRPISPAWTEQQRKQAIRVLEEEKKDMSKLEYGQEFLGLFLEDLQRFFDDELIDKVCTLSHRKKRAQNRTYYMGVDIARMGGDECAYVILDKKDNTHLENVENFAIKHQLTTQTEERIIDYAEKYDEMVKIFLDAGSGTLGVSVFDHLLEDERTKRKIEAINNRSRALNRFGTATSKLLKEDLYNNLRSLMEKGYIHLLNDEKLKLSLRSIQYEYVTHANHKSHMRIFGDYSHLVEALVRAAWCAKDKELNIWIRSIKA